MHARRQCSAVQVRCVQFSLVGVCVCVRWTRAATERNEDVGNDIVTARSRISSIIVMAIPCSERRIGCATADCPFFLLMLIKSARIAVTHPHPKQQQQQQVSLRHCVHLSLSLC